MESLPAASRRLVVTGGICALLAVVFGAFGAHAVRGMITPDLFAAYQTGAQYQFYHALGIIAIGIVSAFPPTRRCIQIAGWLMLAGIVLFSGSLYLLALTGVRLLGAVTPLGGIAFIAAWATFVVSLLRDKSRT